MITIGDHSPSNINPPVNLLQLSLKKNQIAKYPYKLRKEARGEKEQRFPLTNNRSAKEYPNYS
jgi:hypothetical protein